MDEWNDVHVIRKVVARQQAVHAELMAAAPTRRHIGQACTDLDLDDVAATSPKAKAELDELRSRVMRLEQELEAYQTDHSHRCIVCRHCYTPQQG